MESCLQFEKNIPTEEFGELMRTGVEVATQNVLEWGKVCLTL